MKAGWVFVRSNANGESMIPNGVGGNWNSPLEIHVISGGPGALPHDHLLVGGIAQPSSDITEHADALHRHYVINLNGIWVQRTLNATEHTHTLNLVDGQLIPQWRLSFWYGSDSEAALIVASSDCVVAVEASVTVDTEGGGFHIGELDDTTWTVQERTIWETNIKNVMATDLHPDIQNGRHLIALFVGALTSRPGQSERALRRKHT